MRFYKIVHQPTGQYNVYDNENFECNQLYYIITKQQEIYFQLYICNSDKNTKDYKVVEINCLCFNARFGLMFRYISIFDEYNYQCTWEERDIIVDLKIGGKTIRMNLTGDWIKNCDVYLNKSCICLLKELFKQVQLLDELSFSFIKNIIQPFRP